MLHTFMKHFYPYVKLKFWTDLCNHFSPFHHGICCDKLVLTDVLLIIQHCIVNVNIDLHVFTYSK